MEVQLGGFSAGNPIKGICMQMGRLLVYREDTGNRGGRRTLWINTNRTRDCKLHFLRVKIFKFSVNELGEMT
jgi:hypothetical protein